MFLLCFFLLNLFVSCCFFLVYLNLPVLPLNLIHFYLMHYQVNNTEHHKVIYPPYNRNCQVLKRKKENKQKYSYSLQLKGCGHYSLYHYLHSARNSAN